MSDHLKIYKALADETRLRLLRLLSRGALNVNEITAILEMGQSRISRHLGILAEAGLVIRHREGTWIYYENMQANEGSSLLGDVLQILRHHEAALPQFDIDLQRFEAAVERRREQTRTYFDSISDPHQDLAHQRLDGEFYREAALQLLPSHYETVLDIGTGSGLLIPHLLENAERVIAVDHSTRMLQLARGTVGSGESRCDFRLGDLEHLPVADGEVDAVVACMVLHHVSHPQDALAEAHRVLRPGGHLAVVDLHEHSEESLREHLADLWLGFRPAQVKLWLTATNFELLDAAVIVPDSASDFTTDTGLRSERSRALRLITLTGQKPWQ